MSFLSPFLSLLLLPYQAIPLLHTSTEVYPHTESRNRDSLVFTSLGCGRVLLLFIRCSICWQTRLFRAGHKGTMMSYFVNGRRVCLIESNLGRRSCFFLISSRFPLYFLSAKRRLGREIERQLSSRGEVLFFFFCAKKKGEGVGRSTLIVYFFLLPPLSFGG